MQETALLVDESPKWRAVARHLSAVVTGDLKVSAYWDESNRHSVAIATLAERPDPGYAVRSTVSLHASRNELDGEQIPVELLGVARTEDDQMANVLATAAFNVGTSGWLVAPGVVFPGLIAEYVSNASVPDVMWTECFPYPTLTTARVENLDVHWLIAVPLAESETSYLREHGFARLEARLAASDAPYFDLWREPLV